MAAKVSMDSTDLERKLQRLPAVLDRQMNFAMVDISNRIVNHAKRTTLFRDRTGMLRKSIRPFRPRGTWSRGTLSVDVVAGGNRISYALPVHDGSKAHDIVPRNKTILRFPRKAPHTFARRVRHPGTSPRPFMLEAAQAVEPEVGRIVDSFIRIGIREVGLE